MDGAETPRQRTKASNGCNLTSVVLTSSDVAPEEPKTVCSVEDCEHESAGEVTMWQRPPIALKGDEPAVMNTVPLCAKHFEEHEAIKAEAFFKKHPLKAAP